MKELKMDSNGALYIPANELKESCVVIVSGNKAVLKTLKSFGTLEVITQDGKVTRFNEKESTLF